jgi:5-(carboxyamino)imidazole ribonucleotide synthase
MENKIGIVGGGQLGRMLTVDATRLGFSVTVIDPTPGSPAAQVGAKQIVAPLTDETATRQLAPLSDFLTFEIEHINTTVLHELREIGVRVNPSPETLDSLKDKLAQKQFLQSAGIPTAEFVAVNDRQDILEVAREFTYPFVLKSRFGGYDGRGNTVVSGEKDIDTAMRRFEGRPLYAERFVPFQKELAIMLARSMSGDIAAYPVVETVHRNNICHTVLAPAPIDREAYEQAEELGKVTMRHLKGAGVFGIEMFLTEDSRVLINELAPRVHNSGHYTKEACSTSQFEQHIRAITGLPLGETDMIVPAAVMVNILGKRQGAAQLSGLPDALRVPNVGVHIYGKANTKPERKMGHITARANDLEEAQRNAQLARTLISI